MVMTLKNGALNLVYPNLRDPLLRAELARGVGHNTYGEPAWPNDLLYMFPICILAIVFLGLGLAIGLPVEVGEPADPFATPLEILPEWFLLPAFEILSAVPNKLLGISGMVAIPVGLSLVPLGESANRYANPIRRARSVHYSALRRVGMQVAKCLQLVHPAAKTSLELRSAFQGVWLDAQSSSTIRSVHLSSRGPQVLKRLNRRLSLSCYRSLRQSSCWPKRRSHIIGIL